MALLFEACARACELREQMRAVAAEVLREDCERRCEPVLQTPEAHTRREVAALDGLEARLSGVLIGRDQPSLRVEDGTLVALLGLKSSALPPEGSRVVALGLVSAGEGTLQLEVDVFAPGAVP